jgi:hypothetical protein
VSFATAPRGTLPFWAVLRPCKDVGQGLRLAPSVFLLHLDVICNIDHEKRPLVPVLCVRGARAQRYATFRLGVSLGNDTGKKPLIPFLLRIQRVFLIDLVRQFLLEKLAPLLPR